MKKSVKENFKCGICEKYFSSNEYKSLHILNVHGEEKRFICNICNSNFKTKVILKNTSKEFIKLDKEIINVIIVKKPIFAQDI